METITTAEQATKAGEIDGIAEVNDVLETQGREVVLATLRPGHLGWDEGAINARAHRLAGVPEEFSAAYYAGYQAAAVERAEEIRDHEDAA